jgi:hypothetical protein
MLRWLPSRHVFEKQEIATAQTLCRGGSEGFCVFRKNTWDGNRAAKSGAFSHTGFPL